LCVLVICLHLYFLLLFFTLCCDNIVFSYSRISFADICEKLRLESAKDAEYVVAKAIRDGVLEASIDHSGKFMQSRLGTKLYSTSAPYEQFHKRIEFCLNIRNDAVRAMRFPDQPDQTDVLKKVCSLFCWLVLF
jgi:hypothetical protein